MSMDKNYPDIRDFEQEQSVVGPDGPEPDSSPFLLDRARAIILVQEQRKKLADTESSLKKELMAYLAEHGVPYGSEGQHLAVELGTPIRGVVRLVRQARTSSVLDEEAASEIARSRNMFERLFVMKPVLDEGAVASAVLSGELSNEELGRIYPAKTTYAFVTEKTTS